MIMTDIASAGGVESDNPIKTCEEEYWINGNILILKAKTKYAVP
jgi:hypothetical protein